MTAPRGRPDGTSSPVRSRGPLAALGGRLAGLFRRLLLEQWLAIDRECAREANQEAARRAARTAAPEAAAPAADPPGDRRRAKKKRAAATAAPAAAAAPSRWYDWRVVVVLVVVAISLSLQEYYGEWRFFRTHFPGSRQDPDWTLRGYAWWSGARFVGYVVIPGLAIWLLMPGERIRDYYLSTRDFFRHLWIYLVLFALVSPAVIAASQFESFYRTYPFYEWSNLSVGHFLLWEALYILQFLSLEFFFRGFILRGLGRAMGSKAIFVMIVPYCMIHFGKPLPETIGAIFAGIVLGTLAMRTRSIWGGVMIHVGVALTMDLLALGHCPDSDTGLPCRARQ